MSRTDRPWWQRVAVGLLLLAVVGFAFPVAVQAAGTYCDWTYYSDATYTTIVGERVKTCQGQTYTSGTVTIFKLGGCEPCGPPTAAPTSNHAKPAAFLNLSASACLASAR